MKTTREILDKVREVCGLAPYYEPQGAFDFDGEYTNLRDTPHLEHLYISIHNVHNGCVFIYVTSNGWLKVDGHKNKKGIRYDLVKSVEQNLNENEELRRVVSELLF
jgi:hypothetical protein